MPKATWSNSDLNVNDINEAEEREGSYAGPLPTKGVYRFKLKSMKKGESAANNDKITIFVTVDGSWRPDHKKFNGAPMWDHMPLTKEQAWRAKALCAALGVSAADLLNKTVVDDDGYITKIGTKAIKEGMPLYISVKTRSQEGYDPSLQVNGGGYMPAGEADEAQEPGDTDAGDEPPAETKKGAKKKSGKKAASKGEEDPF
jgi:hypothetical protein